MPARFVQTYFCPGFCASLLCLGRLCALAALLGLSLPLAAEMARSPAAAGALPASLPENPFFQSVFADQDIGIGEVEVVLQDREGFIWLGGRNALVRYDGHNYIPIPLRIHPADPSHDIPASHVVDLFEDSRGTLWAATRKGVIRVDRDLRIATKFPDPINDEHNLHHSTINRIRETPQGDIVIGSYAGLSIVNPETLSVKVIRNNPKAPDSPHHLSSLVIHDLLPSPDGQALWLASEKGLSRWDLTTQTFRHFMPNPQAPDSLPDNDIWVIQWDQTGRLWAGTHHGLYWFDPQSETFSRRLQASDEEGALNDNLIRNLLVDKTGTVWVGTDGGGLNVWDEANQRFRPFQHNPALIGSLSANSIRAMYEDNNSDIWIGTYPQGLNFFDRSTSATRLFSHDPANPNSPAHSSILTLQEDADSVLWLGTDGGGVSRFDRTNHVFQHYTKANGKIASNAILSSHIDSKGRLWVGTWGAGVLRYDPASDRFVGLPFDPTLKGKGSGNYLALNDEAVWSIHEDREGYLWIGTHNGGLSRYDEKTGIFTNYSFDPDDDSTLANQLVWSIHEDNQGRLWVGTSNGLDWFDKARGQVKQHYIYNDQDPTSLANNSVLAIYEDPQGRLWFGTDRGLSLLQPDAKSFRNFDKKTGFVDDGIRSITQDTAGALWLGTNKGIVHFHPDTQKIINYDRMAGQKLGGFNTQAALRAHNGDVYFGGTLGLRRFSVSALATNHLVPPLALTDFRIFTKSVDIGGPDKLLERDINRSPRIQLKHTQNMIAFEFAALNFRDSGRNQHAYKLEGFDEDWREVGAQRSALYTNLDPGTYQFHIKASNNDNLWNEAGKSITVVQLPPPWRSLWAYCLYVLAGLGFIGKFLYDQRQKRLRILAENIKLEKLVAERTQALRERHQDVQAMLSNMRQGLFTITTDGRVHAEYSHYLETIVGHSQLAGENAIELLFGQSTLGSDERNQAEESIRAILGEDAINYELNCHALPEELEHKTPGAGGLQQLALSWDPIIQDDRIEKLMVSVRDVTALKAAEKAAASQKRELRMISELLKIPYKKYASFQSSTSHFLTENRAQINACQTLSTELLALLFRNMHTLKGNCRTYGLSELCDRVHDAETVYSHLKKALQNDPSTHWDKQALLEDLNAIDALAKAYHHVYFEVLGNNSEQGSLRLPLLDMKTLQHIQRCITETATQFPDAGHSSSLQSAKILLNIALTNTLSQVLQDILQSLPAIAKQLDKEPPQILIDDANIRINNTGHELLCNIFSHLLRNSLDHGIEPADERLRLGKPAAGRITLESSLQNDGLHIQVKDDGRGINIDRLLEKGRLMHHWAEDDTPSTQEIADFIFASGASTKEQVTAISGRGVGMDAVKQFIEAAGGSISLRLLDEKTDASPYVPFETHLTLPKHYMTLIRYDA
jgi:ligand-binding sensor domain-containing protein/signal transduction histidine kinase